MSEPGAIFHQHGGGQPAASAAVLRPLPTRAARPPGWDLLLTCAALSIATSVGRVHQLFSVLTPLKLALLAAALGLCLYLLQQAGPRRVDRLRSATTTCLVGLLLSALLSVPGALNQGFAFSHATDFVKTVLVFVLIAGSVRTLRDVERLILVYFVSTVVYAAVVLSRFQVGADSWRLGKLYNYDANDFATLIATALPFGLYVALAHRRVLWRVLAVAGLAILAVAQIRSGSRGGFLATSAVAAFVLLRFTTVSARARVGGLVVIIAVAVGASTDQYWSQMQTIIHPKKDYNVTADAGRVKIWERGIGYMVGHPLLGVGIANFQVAEGTISPRARLQERGIGVMWGAAHNSYVQVGAELGVPGLVLFVGVLGTAFASLRRAARRSSARGPVPASVARLAQTIMAGLVGFAVGAFFLSLAFSDMLYTMVALAVAVEKVTRLPRARPSFVRAGALR